MLSKYNNFLLIFNIIFSLAILLALGVYAEVWNEPPASPPNDNPPDLLHVGNIQIKSGGLALNTGGASPDGLTVATGTVEIFGGGGLNVFGDITSGRTINAKVFCLGNNCIDKWPCSISATPWSSCSKPCGGGTRTRTVTKADCSTEIETEICNPDPCPPCTLQCAGGSSCPWDYSAGRRSCCNVSRQVPYNDSCEQNTGSYTATGCATTRVYCR